MNGTYGSWERWFAWHPVRTEEHGWRWLCTVERALYYYPSHLTDAPPPHLYPSYLTDIPSPYWCYRPTPNNRRETETPNERPN